DTNNTNNAPSSKKTKNKKKSLAVTTSEDVSPSRQEPLSPTTPAPDTGDGGIENVNKNPYIEVINKRIRTLKKKLNKIEKVEEVIRNNPEARSQLNPDQIQSLERKSEVTSTLKELEEIVKQFEKEDIKSQKAQQQEREQAISSAVGEVKAVHSQYIISLVKFFRLVQLHKSGATRLNEVESESLETLQTSFFNIAESSKDEQVGEQRTLEILEHLKKLHLGDEKNISKSNGSEITYLHIRSLIQCPPINTEEEAEHENTEAREIVINQEEGTNHHDDNLGDVYTIPAGGLQFMLSHDEPSSQDPAVNQNIAIYQYTNTGDDQPNPIVTDNNDIQEPYQKQQTFTETYVTQEYTVEQQDFPTDQTDQNQFSADQQQEQSVNFQEQSKQVTDDQSDAQQPPKSASQQYDQPPPLSRSSSNRGRGYRGRGGHRGQGPNLRRDSRDGNYRNGGHGGNFRGGNRGGGGGGNAYSGRGRSNGYHQGGRGPNKPRSQ
ncbi:11374_t:CDS:2, partial [Acaulospora morrowiae]